MDDPRGLVETLWQLPGKVATHFCQSRWRVKCHARYLTKAWLGPPCTDTFSILPKTRITPSYSSLGHAVTHWHISDIMSHIPIFGEPRAPDQSMHSSEGSSAWGPAFTWETLPQALEYVAKSQDGAARRFSISSPWGGVHLCCSESLPTKKTTGRVNGILWWRLPVVRHPVFHINRVWTSTWLPSYRLHFPDTREARCGPVTKLVSD